MKCSAPVPPLSQGNIELSYSCHVAHPDLFPSFQHVNNITRFSKALVTPAAMAGLTLGECGRHGGKIASHLGAGIRHVQLTLKRPGLKKVLAQTFADRVAETAIVHRPLMPYGEFCV
jgi:hypothetical protein